MAINQVRKWENGFGFLSEAWSACWSWCLNQWGCPWLYRWQSVNIDHLKSSAVYLAFYRWRTHFMDEEPNIQWDHCKLLLVSQWARGWFFELHDNYDIMLFSTFSPWTWERQLLSVQLPLVHCYGGQCILIQRNHWPFNYSPKLVCWDVPLLYKKRLWNPFDMNLLNMVINDSGYLRKIYKMGHF